MSLVVPKGRRKIRCRTIRANAAPKMLLKQISSNNSHCSVSWVGLRLKKNKLQATLPMKRHRTEFTITNPQMQSIWLMKTIRKSTFQECPNSSTKLHNSRCKIPSHTWRLVNRWESVSWPLTIWCKSYRSIYAVHLARICLSNRARYLMIITVGYSLEASRLSLKTKCCYRR